MIAERNYFDGTPGCKSDFELFVYDNRFTLAFQQRVIFIIKICGKFFFRRIKMSGGVFALIF